MKRFAICLSLMVTIIISSGCSILTNAVKRVLPHHSAAVEQTSVASQIEPSPTAEPEPSPSPEAATTAPAETETASIQYTSTALGLAFTMPGSWADKYRVQEGDGYLAVYFKPASTIEDGLGKFFTVMKKTSEDDGGYFDDEVQIEINDVTYICGSPTDVAYSEENPEYEAYVKMKQDVPAIIQSICAACN